MNRRRSPRLRQMRRLFLGILGGILGILASICLLGIWDLGTGGLSPAWGQGDADVPAATMPEVVSASPATCRVGVYVTGLRGFDFLNQSFTVDFKVWSVCPSADLKPLETLSIVDSIDWSLDNVTQFEVENNSNNFSPRDTLYWTQGEIKATLYYRWDFKNYPFDRQYLTINLQESAERASRFIYTPDFSQSGYQKALDTPGWNIKQFGIREQTTVYASTFGNPRISQGEGQYSRLVVSLDLVRSDVISFLKLTAGVYAAVALSAMSLFLDQDYADRLGILVGTLFAAVVNLQVADSSLGQTSTFTLTDLIHVTAIVYIFAAACISLYSRHLTDNGNHALAIRIDRQISLPLFVISFCVFNAIVIAYAAIVG